MMTTGIWTTYAGELRQVAGKVDGPTLRLRDKSDVSRLAEHVDPGQVGDVVYVSVHARWRGGDIVVARHQGDDTVVFVTSDSALAEREGLYGDWYGGWGGIALVDELSAVEESSRVLRSAGAEARIAIERAEEGDRWMDEAGLVHALQQAGVEHDAVVLASAPEPGAPAPVEGPWLIVPYGAQFVVGAVGRGKFATYESLWTERDAISLAVRLAAEPLRPRSSPCSEAELAGGRRTAQGVATRTAARQGAAGPHGLSVGDGLDLIGVETGHHLYALGTPGPQRSQPPSDVGAPYFTFKVAKPLPPSAMEGRAAPWFGQPGGGAMVVLDRPVRWYVDYGYLVQPSALAG